MFVLTIHALCIYALIVLFIEFYILCFSKPSFCFLMLKSSLLLMVTEFCFHHAMSVEWESRVEGNPSYSTWIKYTGPLSKCQWDPGHILGSLLGRGKSAGWHLMWVGIQYSYSAPHCRSLCFLVLASYSSSLCPFCTLKIRHYLAHPSTSILPCKV